MSAEGGKDLHALTQAWIDGDPDPETRAELRALLGSRDVEALNERMGQALSFGTAGLRGLLGAGQNRMNRAVVRRTSKGLVDHVLAAVPFAKTRGIVVGYDARRGSRVFAEDSAAVFAAAGVTVHFFADVVSTPVTSFAVAHLGAAAGVMVTASHNPADYNGYKVYWENSAQIVPPHDERIARAIDIAPAANRIELADFAAALGDGRIQTIGPELEEAYLAGVVDLLCAKEVRPPLSIVYTPMHGVGYAMARRAFIAAGFTKVESVPRQTAPDPAFPTVRFPNPEEPGALDLALEQAIQERADLVLANDPDADRLAVAVPDGSGRFVQLTGNQVGALLGHYVLTQASRRDGRAVISTIVSSPMLGEMAREFGVHYEETLTGFKWIATRAMDLEAEGTRFVFGFEEALGYSVGNLVRDKDGISAAVLFAELAAVCRAQGTTVLAYLADLYRRFGYFASVQKNLVLEGTKGAAEIAAMMSALRTQPPQAIGDRVIVEQRDYKTGTRTTKSGPATRLSLPSSNVLAYWLDGGTRVVIRPSGTEPKLKYYIDHREPLTAAETLDVAEARAHLVVEKVDSAVLALLHGAPKA